MANFNKFVDSYDTVLDRTVAFGGDSSVYFTNYKARYFDRIYARCGAGPVLDYGCGVGNLTEALARLRPQARIDGFDPSADSIARLRGRSAEKGFARGGTFTSDLNELRPPYSYILVSNVMHHVLPAYTRPSLVKALAEMLAPGGQLVVFEHNPVNPATRWVVHTCPFDDDAVLVWPRRLTKMMQQCGLTPDCRYIVFFPKFLAVLRGLEPKLGWLPAGAQYCMTGTKPPKP